jgi:hypothetical protein
VLSENKNKKTMWETHKKRESYFVLLGEIEWLGQLAASPCGLCELHSREIGISGGQNASYGEHAFGFGRHVFLDYRCWVANTVVAMSAWCVILGP